LFPEKILHRKYQVLFYIGLSKLETLKIRKPG